MWDNITDQMGVVLSVDLFNREDGDIMDILFGKPWEALSTNTQQDTFHIIVCDTVCKILRLLDL